MTQKKNRRTAKSKFLAQSSSAALSSHLTRQLLSLIWVFVPHKGEERTHLILGAKDSQGPAPSNEHWCKTMENNSPQVETNICLSI